MKPQLPKGQSMGAKGQTSLDFLMTYGWAVLLVVVVVASLFALGVFNAGSFLGPRATGFSQIGVIAWNVNAAGILSLRLQNFAGMDINVINIAASYGTSSYSYDITNVSIPNSKISDTFTVGTIGGLAPGQYYTLPLKITYTDLNGFNYTETGTISGTVGAGAVPPSIQINSPHSDSLLNNRTINISVSVWGGNLSYTDIMIIDESGAPVNVTTNSQLGTYSVLLDVQADGVYNITAIAYYTSSNRSAVARNITVNTTVPPSLQCGDPLDIPDHVYTLTDDVSSGGTCFTIGADSVTLDCDGHIINGSGAGDGVYLDFIDGAVLENCVISNFSNDINFVHTSDDLIRNVTVSDANEGVRLDYSADVNVTDSNVFNNYHGIYVTTSYSPGVISNNTIWGNVYEGLNFGGGSGEQVYNNLFNNTYNIAYLGGGIESWNTTLDCGPGTSNIVGGPCIGGNFWADSSGTGFSENCTTNGSSNSSGICTVPYDILGDGSNIDELALTTNFTAGLSCVQPPSGLVAWWPGDDNTRDIIGGNDGTLQGGATYAQGIVGRAFEVNGVDSYVNFTQLDLGTNYSFSVWLKSYDTSPPNRVIFANSTSAYGVLFNMQYFDNRLYSSNANEEGTVSFSNWKLNEWQHFAVTRQDRNVSFYADGAYVGSYVFADNGPISPDNFGSMYNSQLGYSFNGVIDEPAVYDRALNASEIQAIYGAGSAGVCQPPPPQANLSVNITAPLNDSVLSNRAVTVNFTVNGTSPDHTNISILRRAVDNYVWVVNSADNTVSTIDKSANVVVGSPIGVGSNPGSVAVDQDSVWVTNFYDNTVSRINKTMRVVIANITVGTLPDGIAVDKDSVWVANYNDATVSRINKSNTSDVTTIYGFGSVPNVVAVDENSVWVTNSNSDTVSRINKTTSTNTMNITVGSHPVGVAVDQDSVWVANYGSDTVSRINKTTNTIITNITVGSYPTGVAVDQDSVWVANFYADSVSRINKANTNDVTTINGVGSNPNRVAIDEDSVWVTNYADGTVSRINKTTNATIGSPIGVGSGSNWGSDATGYAYDMFFSTINSTTVSTTSSGDYSATLDVPADGVYSINATVYDALGNSNSSEASNITIDTIAPDVSFVDGTTQTGPRSQDWIFANVSAADYGSGINSTTLYLFNGTGLVSSKLLNHSGWSALDGSGNRYWISIASSADGRNLIASHNGVDYLLHSGDHGSTWIPLTDAGQHRWGSVASSSDGTRLAAAYGQDESGYVYTSDDSGATWTERTGSGSRRWVTLASSSDSTKLAAAAYSGYIYTSNDSGATWAERTGAGSGGWRAIASSADGTRLVTSGSGLYVSGDSGETWDYSTNIGGALIACSEDCNYILAAQYQSGYLRYSTNFGGSWGAYYGLGQNAWSALASSSDGTSLAAAMAYGGSILISNDSGSNWIAQTSAGGGDWTAIASSSDFSRIFAAGYDLSPIKAFEAVGSIYNFTGLADGTYRLNATAIDNAGNSNSAEVIGIIVNTTSPPQPAIGLSSCTNISYSGRYVLSGGQYGYGYSGLYGNDCFDIQADNVTLDCNGSTITGLNNGSGYGVYGSGQNHVTVENCNITQFNYGIYLSSSNNNTISDVTVESNHGGDSGDGYGVYLSGSSNTISGVTASSNYGGQSNGVARAGFGYGIHLSGSSNTIANVTASGNGGGHSNANDVSAGSGYGIHLSGSSNTISGVTASGNGGGGNYGGYGGDGCGIYLSGNSNTISDLTAENNNGAYSHPASGYGYGIYLSGDSNTISGVIVISNHGGDGTNGGSGHHGYGIFLNASDSNTISDVTADSNNGGHSAGNIGGDGYGIFLNASSSNTISDVTAEYNTGGQQTQGVRDGYGYGIYAKGSSGNLIRNDFLNDQIPAYSDTGGNGWNTTLSCDAPGVTNIIGGPCIGGNFYSGFSHNASSSCNPSPSYHNGTICQGAYTVPGGSGDVDQYPLAAVDCGTLGPLNTSNTAYNMTIGMSSKGTCFTIEADNVTIDCNGHSITGYVFYGYGINNSAGYDGVVVKNCVITKFLRGIDFENGANYGTIENDSISSNSNYGVYLGSSSGNTIANDTLNSNGNYGIYLTSSSNSNTIANDTIGSNGNYGVYLGSSSSNLFYNNFLNNSDDVQSDGSQNLWNTTLSCSGPQNIVGGPCIGGNYWATLAGTGFSQNQSACDANSSGVCAVPYPIPSSGDVDHFPITNLPPAPLSVSITSPLSNTVVTTPIVINFTAMGGYLQYTNISVYNSTGDLINSTLNYSGGPIGIQLGVPEGDGYNITATAYDTLDHNVSSTVSGLNATVCAPFNIVVQNNQNWDFPNGCADMSQYGYAASSYVCYYNDGCFGGMFDSTNGFWWGDGGNQLGFTFNVPCAQAQPGDFNDQSSFGAGIGTQIFGGCIGGAPTHTCIKDYSTNYMQDFDVASDGTLTLTKSCP